MKKLFGFLALFIACLIVGAGAFLFVVAPTDIIRDQVIAAVKRETGRDLVVRGGTSLSVYPALGVKLKDVELSLPPEMQNAGNRDPFIRMASLHLSVPLGPLLRQEVQIKEFRLDRPVVNLLLDNRGRKSWEFASRPAPRRIVHRAQIGAGDIKQLRLGDLRITNGELIYQNQQLKSREQVSNVSLVAALETLSAPLSLEGEASWRGRPFRLDAQVRSPQDLLDGKPAKLSGQIISQSEQIELNGQISGAPSDPLYRGRAIVRAPAADSLADLMALELPPRKALQSLAIDGVLDVRPQRIGFSKTEFKLGSTSLQGDVVIDLDGARPFVTGTLTTEALNLDEFLFDNIPASPKSQAPLRPSKTRFWQPERQRAGVIRAQYIPRPAPPPGNTPETRFDLPTRNSSENESAEDEPRWSTIPINMSALRMADAALNLSAEAIYYRKLQTSNAAATLKLNKGALDVVLNRADLYNGRADGKLQLLAIGTRPSLTGNIKLTGLEALPFLKALNGFDWVAGTASATVEFVASGEHQQALVKNLDGRGIFRVTDGAIVGVNIPQMLRGIKQGDFSNFQRQETKSTDFSALDGSFTMLGGIVQTNDTRLASPLLRVSTTGQIDVPRRRLDLRVDPRLVSSLSGQNATNDGSGFNIPFSLRGPWRRPAVVPDLNGILKNPDTVIDAAKNLGRKFKNGKIKGKDIENVLKGLFGGR